MPGEQEDMPGLQDPPPPLQLEAQVASHHKNPLVYVYRTGKVVCNV